MWYIETLKGFDFKSQLISSTIISISLEEMPKRKSLNGYDYNIKEKYQITDPSYLLHQDDKIFTERYISKYNKVTSLLENCLHWKLNKQVAN